MSGWNKMPQAIRFRKMRRHWWQTNSRSWRKLSCRTGHWRKQMRYLRDSVERVWGRSVGSVAGTLGDELCRVSKGTSLYFTIDHSRCKAGRDQNKSFSGADRFGKGNFHFLFENLVNLHAMGFDNATYFYGKRFTTSFQSLLLIHHYVWMHTIV